MTILFTIWRDDLESKKNMKPRFAAKPLNLCVIGAGAAGLVATRELLAVGHRVRTFEARGELGGLWNDGYESLHLITAKNLCGLDGFPIPEDYPLFPHRDQIIEYFNRYADHFDLHPHISLETPVTSVRPIGAAGLGGWLVTAEGAEPERFDAVVIANGHLSTPIVPELPGDYTGKFLHAYEYRSDADFAGDSVLVIGAGNSGCDIAVDAVQAHHTTSIVIRKGQVFQPKTLLGRGRTELPGRFLPPVVRERIMRAAMRIAYGTSRDYPGLPEPKTQNVEKNPGVINTQVLHWIHHGRLTVRPAIRSVDGTNVTFEDGSSGQFETIVAATGYKTALPFLSDDMIPWSGDHPLRFAEGTVFPGLANMYVIGLVGPQGAQWPVYERQSRAVIRLMALQSVRHRPISQDLAEIEEPWTEVNMLRWVWDRRVDRFERRLARLERRLGRTSRTREPLQMDGEPRDPAENLAAAREDSASQSVGG